MRILFAHKLPYSPALNGATRISQCLLESLAKRGHECRVIALVELRALRSANPTERVTPAMADGSPSRQVFHSNGVEVYAYANAERLHEHLRVHIQEFDPTWIIISEDPTYMLLAAAIEFDSRRTLFLSQSQATLPFGPEAFASDPFKEQMLHEVSGILTSSEYLRDYLERWAGLESFVASVPVYGAPPFPYKEPIDNPYVTIINPSNIKGLPIFLELARRFPEATFAAVPTWATTAADRCALESLPNVKILEASERIDTIFTKTRVLLVPSLWGEAFGLVVVEAMLRGIPVLASKVGGLADAKLGVDFLLPVHRIEKYESRRDEHGIPIAAIPDQDVDLWDATLRKLINDRAEFNRISVESKKAATDYVSGLSIDPTEQWLKDLSQRQQSSTIAGLRSRTKLLAMLDGLPAKKLEVIASHLKKLPKHS